MLTQFLIEAATVSALGGIFGVVLGVGSTTVAMRVQKLPPAIVWTAIAGAVLMSATAGIVFGLHPAWKPSNIDPVAALRL